MFFCEKIYCQQFFYISSLGNILHFCVYLNTFGILGGVAPRHPNCFAVLQCYIYSKMVAGFLGAEAPKQREKDRLGRGEGKEKLL